MKRLFLMLLACLVLLSACSKETPAATTTPETQSATTQETVFDEDPSDTVYLGFPDSWIPIHTYDSYEESIKNPFYLDDSMDYVLFLFNYNDKYVLAEYYTNDKELYTNIFEPRTIDYDNSLYRLVLDKENISNSEHYTLNLFFSLAKPTKFITFKMTE